MVTLFRLVALFEGLSYIALLFIAVPIKYMAGDAQYVKMLGMPHGLLFMGYIILAFLIKDEMRWSKKQFRFVLLAAIIPFATFIVERNYIQKSNA